MAYNSTLTQGHSVSGKSVAAAISAFFSSIGEKLVSIGNKNYRMKKVEMLQAKSDAELAAMGLTRDDIVYYVFRDVYYL